MSLGFIPSDCILFSVFFAQGFCGVDVLSIANAIVKKKMQILYN